MVSTQTESREFLDLMYVLNGERSFSFGSEEDKFLSEERRMMGSVARLRLANMFEHVTLGNLKDAERTFLRALQLLPSFEAHVNLGIVLRDQNRVEDATTHFREASRLADVLTKHKSSKKVVKDGKIVAREIEVAVEVPERAPRREEHLSVLRILTDLCRNSGDLDCAIDTVAKMCNMMRVIARENPTSSTHAKDLIETLWLHSRILRKDSQRIREATAILSEAMLIGQGSVPPYNRIGDIEKEYVVVFFIVPSSSLSHVVISLIRTIIPIYTNVLRNT